MTTNLSINLSAEVYLTKRTIAHRQYSGINNGRWWNRLSSFTKF